MQSLDLDNESIILKASFVLVPQDETFLEVLLSFAFFILFIAGVIVVFFREAIVGIMILGRFAQYLASMLISNKNYLSWFDLVFPIIDLLNLFCCWQSRETVLQAPNKNVSK